MSSDDRKPLSPEELDAETGTVLPTKEVMSLLDLNVDLDLALDVAAPIDLAVAANANIAAPIEAAVGANVLSADSKVGSMTDQTVNIKQGLDGQAIAHAPQVSTIDQTDQGGGAPAPGGSDTGATPGTGSDNSGSGTGGSGTGGTGGSGTSVGAGNLLNGNLLNVDVNAALDAKLAAPIDGAVAANANAAAPIDASVGANIASTNSEATAVATQHANIDQQMHGDARATADQQSDIKQ